MQHLSTAKVIVDIIVPVGGLTLLIISAVWARREWRYQYITKEWGALVQFLITHATFMDARKNDDYMNSYDEQERLKYEIVARLCLGYLDDVYHLGYGRFHKDWLIGSVQFLAGAHRRWLEDHKGSYSPEFRQFLNDHM